MNLFVDDLEPSEREWLVEPGNPAGSYFRERASCPPVRLIRASLVDALPEDLQEAVTKHITSCGACRRLQLDFEGLPPPQEITPQESRRILSRVRESARGEGLTTALSRRSLLLRIAIAATCLVCCAALAYWHVRRTPSEPALPDQAASMHQRAPEAEFPDVFKLDKPDVKLTPAVLTWRGTSGSGQKLLNDIAPALDAYRAGRYAEAASRFDTLCAKHPDSIEVFFYLGVSRLFLGNNDAAAVALRRAAELADSAFAADVSWYLGLACQKSGRIAEAQANFSSLCRGKTAYAPRACAAIDALDHSVASR